MTDAHQINPVPPPTLSVQGTMLIAAPRQQVYDLFVDIERLSDRISTIFSAEMLTDGPIREGSRVRITRKVQASKLTYDARYSDVAPGESFCAEIELNGTNQSTILVFADEEGLTRVDYCIDIRPLSFLTKLFWKLLASVVRRQLEKQVETELQEFKAVAEAEFIAQPNVRADSKLA